ncbi:MAG: ECF transporter S component [Oscillospiraceae bacterium]|nr:ECF transporter S component [Oscillospiraceae bacterium]
MKNELFKPNTETSKVRQLTVTAMMGAMAAVLMFFDFPVPMFMPGFIKFDLSELPALIASFAIGPLSGAGVCLLKNLLHILCQGSGTGGVGELSNFILGCAFVVPAGLIYKSKKTKTRAIIGATAGAAAMAIFSIFSNYFFIYPIYTKFMPMEAIISAYQKLNPHVENLLDALIWFNLPFTFIKGMCSTVITVAIYKYISPILKHGRAQKTVNS